MFSPWHKFFESVENMSYTLLPEKSNTSYYVNNLDYGIEVVAQW